MYIDWYMINTCMLFYVVCGGQVEMMFDIEKGTPDTDVVMSLKASPDSLCAYGTVDKSVFLKGGDNQLSLSTISDMLQGYTLSEWSG